MLLDNDILWCRRHSLFHGFRDQVRHGSWLRRSNSVICPDAIWKGILCPAALRVHGVVDAVNLYDAGQRELVSHVLIPELLRSLQHDYKPAAPRQQRRPLLHIAVTSRYFSVSSAFCRRLNWIPVQPSWITATLVGRGAGVPWRRRQTHHRFITIHERLERARDDRVASPWAKRH